MKYWQTTITLWFQLAGGDSDLVLDIIEKLKGDKHITYVWFNTGLEYQATKDHLEYLEKKYNIEILREPPTHSIPYCCKEYGLPFLSKKVSEEIESLQHYGFKWEDRPYEELIEEYPKIKSRIAWWCNHYPVANGYKTTMFNINHNKWLKEFLIKNPPLFKISAKCCKYAKKLPNTNLMSRMNADLNIIGVRRCEGGTRSLGNTCFTTDSKGVGKFRPIFWLTNTDKKIYEELFNITHSDCYKVYGLQRTGCVGCPYAYSFYGENELETIKKYEPKLYKACMNIFGESYEYTKKYREFYVEQEEKLKCNSQNATT